MTISTLSTQFFASEKLKKKIDFRSFSVRRTIHRNTRKVQTKCLLIVVAFTSLARIFGEGRSFHVCALFIYLSIFQSADQLVHTGSTFYARISPQWLRPLRRLRPNVP